MFWPCVYYRAAERKSGTKENQRLNINLMVFPSPFIPLLVPLVQTGDSEAQKDFISSSRTRTQGPSRSLTMLDSFVFGSTLISWSEMPTSYRSCCKGESVTRTEPSWAIRPWLWDLSTWQRWEGHSLQCLSPRPRETHQAQPVEPSKWFFQPSGWVLRFILQVDSIFGNSGYTFLSK